MNRLILMVLGAVLTASCGGGGSSSTNPSVYSGKTTAAEINDGSVAVTRSATVVSGAMAQGELIASLSGSLAGARLPMARVYTDGCGGSVDETETGDATAGSYSATFDTFHPDCPTLTPYLDGGLQVSWTDQGSYMHNAVALNQFGYTEGADHFLFDGTFVWNDYDDGHDVYTATFEASLGAQSFKADNFELQANAAGMYRVSGRYYLSQYGYIDFETTQNFVWGACPGDAGPESGIIEITAAGGDVWTLDFATGNCGTVQVTGPTGAGVYSWPDGVEVIL